jgi:trans-2,3-dihydro-3-hydroxyanthranilate isomerase
MSRVQVEYDVVDVFAEAPFAGNQLAVVHGTDGLSGAQLLALTREFNFSETTFPTPLDGGRYRVRIFTRDGEVPFAGHPTLGTAWVLRERGAIDGDAVQLCAVGEIGVRFLRAPDDLVDLTALRRELGEVSVEKATALLADLGLDPSALTGPARYAGAGLTFVYLPVDEEAVRTAGPGRRPLRDYDIATLDPLEGVAVHSMTAPGQAHARVFIPGAAGFEDPATGSAAAGLGALLAESGQLGEDGRLTISQGAEIGRPSRLHVRVPPEQPGSVQVAGAVRPIANGRIRIP